MVHTGTSEDSILDIPEGLVKHGHGEVPLDRQLPVFANAYDPLERRGLGFSSNSHASLCQCI
jgi:hypothetical protein